MVRAQVMCRIGLARSTQRFPVEPEGTTDRHLQFLPPFSSSTGKEGRASCLGLNRQVTTFDYDLTMQRLGEKGNRLLVLFSYQHGG